VTVSQQTPVNSSTGNGVTTVFPYTFKIVNQADIEVTVDGVVKTLTTDYTVSGVGDDAGGNITFVTAPAADTTVVRRRNMAFVRTVDYQDQGDLRSDTLNPDQDAPILMLQQVQEQAGRSLRYPAGEAAADELPAAADRASLYLVFDAQGRPSVSAGTGTDAGLRADLADSDGAGLLGFSHAETYAAGTLGAKGKLCVTVRDAPYSADNTGAVASNTAIQAAIDAVSAAGGGIVYVPPGTYLMAAGLTLQSKVALVGAGPGASVLTATASIASMVLINTKTDVRVAGLTLQGNHVASPTDGNFGGIQLANSCQRVLIENCELKDFRGNGVDLNVSNAFVTLRQNRLSNCRVGVSVFKGNARIRIVDNDLYRVREIGINVDDATSGDTAGTASPNSYVVVARNHLLEVGTVAGSVSIACQGSSYVDIEGNMIARGGRSPVTWVSCNGIVINAGQGEFNRSQYVNVRGNHISECTAEAIKVLAAQAVTVTGNHCHDNWQWQSVLAGDLPEVLVDSGASLSTSNVLVAANMLADNGTAAGQSNVGLRIDDANCTAITVGSNQFKNFTPDQTIKSATGSGGTLFAGHEYLSTLPTFTSSFRSRLVHQLVDDKLYLATNAGWVVVGTQT
jgi:hypothetical protein